MKERSRRYSEIILLACLLEKKGIPYQMTMLHDGYQIRVPDTGKHRYLIREHEGSVGCEENRLEVWRGGIVRGYESAEILFAEIEEDYNERK